MLSKKRKRSNGRLLILIASFVHYLLCCILILFAYNQRIGCPPHLPNVTTLTSLQSAFIVRKYNVFPFTTFPLHHRTLLFAPCRRLRIGGKLSHPGCSPLTLYPQHSLSDLIICDSELGCANFLLDEILKLHSSRLELVHPLVLDGVILCDAIYG